MKNNRGVSLVEIMVAMGIFAVSVYMKIDQVMIKEMISTEAVGLYSAAIRLTEIWYVIPMVIASSIFPGLINAKKESEILYYKRLQKFYDLMAFLSLAIVLPIFFFADPIVNLLYGDQYSQAGNVLMISVFSGVFVFFGIASGRWFIIENLQIYLFYRALAGVFTAVMFNFLLIPKYGINGAAFATLFSQFFSFYLFNIFNRITRNTFYSIGSFFNRFILFGIFFYFRS